MATLDHPPGSNDRQRREGARDQNRQDAKRRQAPSGGIVYRAIRKEGEEELERPSAALAWSGLAAGLSMGFSLITEGLLRRYLPEAAWRPLVAKLGYSVGFLIVILGRQQLFTENTLTVILPLLYKRDRSTLGNVARLWAVVLGTNLVGALAVAWVLGNTTVFEPDVRRAFAEMAAKSMEPAFGTILLRAIFAGWLIATMVWLLPFAESARVWVIVIVTYVVGIGGFSHVVAGSAEVFYLAATGERSFGDVLGSYVLPTLLGNILGGVSLVAALNHAQVVAGGNGQDV